MMRYWIVIVLLAAAPAAHAIVKHAPLPAPSKLCPDDPTETPLDQRLQAELNNPAFNAVVKLYNVNVGAQDLWSGTLISSEWVLTCAHTLQGTNGQGGGIDAADIAVEIPGHDPLFASDFVVHPGWNINGFTGGDDIALVKLESPVTNSPVFPALSGSLPPLPQHTVFIGYGNTGTGDTGWQNGSGGARQIGVNWLDAVGGSSPTDGDGNSYAGISSYSGNTIFMDFDEIDIETILCVPDQGEPFIASYGYLKADQSSMGPDNKLINPVIDCNDNTIGNSFYPIYCDYLPASGDSGGPAFAGDEIMYQLPVSFLGKQYYVSGPAKLIGLVSEVQQGKAGGGFSVYGNTVALTLVHPYLGWIYQQAPEVGAADSDGDGQSNQDELAVGTDPYDPDSSFDIIAGPGADGIVFHIPTVAGMNYRIEYQSAANAPGWSTAALIDPGAQAGTTIDHFEPFAAPDGWRTYRMWAEPK